MPNVLSWVLAFSVKDSVFHPACSGSSPRRCCDHRSLDWGVTTVPASESGLVETGATSLRWTDVSREWLASSERCCRSAMVDTFADPNPKGQKYHPAISPIASVNTMIVSGDNEKRPARIVFRGATTHCLQAKCNVTRIIQPSLLRTTSRSCFHVIPMVNYNRTDPRDVTCTVEIRTGAHRRNWRATSRRLHGHR